MTIFIQLLLAAIITALAFLMTLVGIQVFHILHEFRLTLKKVNKILDHTHTLSDAASRPVTAVDQFFTDVKDLVNETQDDIIDNTPDTVLRPPHQKEKFHQRFFHRSGLPLRPS